MPSPPRKDALLLHTAIKTTPSKVIPVSELKRGSNRHNPKKRRVADIRYEGIDHLEINEGFTRAISQISEQSPLLYITGRAGTGKTTFLNYLRASNTSKNIVVVAPTGVAALNAGGQTIHSLFHFKPGPISLDSITEVANRILYEKIDTLVIDEVSMVRADMLDAIERFLYLNGPHKGKLFGGVQIVFVGDLFQLPPVVSTDDEALFLSSNYDGIYFFDAFCLKPTSLAFVEFTKIYRQADDLFIELLNNIREALDIEKTVKELNRQCCLNEPDRNHVITLTCTNAAASKINNVRLSELNTRLYQYQGIIEGQFEISRDRLPSPFLLELKKGALVMFTKNDPFKRWVNGTLGIVHALDDNSISVRVRNRDSHVVHEVERVCWESLAHAYDSEQKRIVVEVVGSYRQFPMMLAWAVTIHKSQGKTLENVIVDLGAGAFASGQAYVALSRCRSIQGLRLKRPLKEKDIKCDPRIKVFHENYRKLSQ